MPAEVTEGRDDPPECQVLERPLRQSHDMEVVRLLAGGIAHDLNNALTGVLTNAQLLEMSLAEDQDEARQDLGDILTAARRGADLVKSLMSLARADTGSHPLRLDARSAVAEVSRTVRRMLPESIVMVLENAPAELPCLVDEGELHQALLNLATNARDAMPDGGVLAIRTRATADTVVIEVGDSGIGMTPETTERIFEPFLTPKAPGKGTGRGLAMVYGFVRRAGGSMTVSSRLGVGTTMTLTFPRAAGEDAAASPSGEAH